MNVGHGTFTPSVLSVTGGEGTKTSTFRCHLASCVVNSSQKRREI